MTVDGSTEPRKLGNEVHHIRVAAAVEAIAFGHPEVDVEHLLLGLLVLGGPSAQILSRTGIGPDAFRRAIGDMQERELAELGIDLAPPAPTPLRAADRFVGMELPLNDRARDLIETPSYFGDDRGLLRALLDDHSGRIARLVEHLGADVDDLREKVAHDPLPPATTPSPGGGRPSAAPSGPPPSGTFWVEATLTHDLPVPVDRVWPMISDPGRRHEWDPFCRSVTVDDHGVEQVTPPEGAAVTQTVRTVVPEREITWDRLPGTGVTETSQIVLTELAEGTRLTLHRHFPGRGRTWRVLRPLLVRLVRAQLRAQAQGIGQAAT